MSGPPIRLTFYSDADYFGGAEGYLALLAGHLDRREFDLSAVVTAKAVELEARFRSRAVTVHHLDRPGFDWLHRLPEMIRVFRRAGGDVLHMNLPSAYDAGVSSIAWAARQAGYRRVVSTEHLPMIERRYQKFPAKLFFTHWVDRIVTVAEANRFYLTRRHGIPADKVCVIPNGVEDVAPMPEEERRSLRRSWGLAAGDAASEPVIGIVARLTRRKGHHLLLQALALLRDGAPPSASWWWAKGRRSRRCGRRRRRSAWARGSRGSARVPTGRDSCRPSICSSSPPRSRRCP